MGPNRDAVSCSASSFSDYAVPRYGKGPRPANGRATRRFGLPPNGGTITHLEYHGFSPERDFSKNLRKTTPNAAAFGSHSATAVIHRHNVRIRLRVQ